MTDEEHRERNREYNRRYRERHKEEIRQRQRDWERSDYSAHPEKYRSKAQQFYARHREKILAQLKAEYQEDPEPRREQSREYERNNRAERRQKAAIWRAQNPEHRAAYRKQYNETNAEKVKDWHQARRARKLNAPVIEHFSREGIYERDGGRCHICHRLVPRSDFHLDHLVPLAHGGDHAPRNLAVAHPLCNHKRGAGWLPAQLRLIP